MQKAIPEAKVRCSFKPNALADEVLKNLEEELETKAWPTPELVVISCGTNNFSSPFDKEEKKQYIRSLHTALKKLRNQRVILANVPYRHDNQS